MFRIARATQQHSAEIQQLRREAYRSAPEFQLRNESLLAWGADDAQGIVLAVWHEDAVVSTTRANILRDKAEAERFLECDLTDIRLGFPTLVLSKLATSPGFGRHGLNSMLRYVFIRAAHACGIASLTGAMFEGAPRMRLMRRIGYEHFVPKRVWHTVVNPSVRTLIAVLPSDSFAMALSTLAAETDLTYVPESLCAEVALGIRAVQGHGA